MAYLYEALRALRFNELQLADLGSHPVWQEADGTVHLRPDCRSGATVALIDAPTLEKLDTSGSTCLWCGVPEAHNGPWGATLYLTRAVVRAAVSLRRDRKTTGGTPDHPLNRWLQVCVTASNVAAGQFARLTLDYSGDGVPEQAHEAMKVWLDRAVAAAQARLDAKRAQLRADMPLERLCWRYVTAVHTPRVPDGRRCPVPVAKAAARKWQLALNHGEGPRSAARRAVEAAADSDRPAIEELVGAWQTEAQAIIDASLAGTWHDLAIIEPRLAAKAAYNTDGTPARKAEHRHVVLAYFPGTHLAEHDMLLTTVPSVIAAAFSPARRNRQAAAAALAADLGPHPVFPTPEHLAVALRLRSGGGLMRDLSQAADTAKTILTPTLGELAYAA